MQISVHSKRIHLIWLFGVDAAPSEEEEEPQMVVHLAGGDLTPAPTEQWVYEEGEEDRFAFGFAPSTQGARKPK